ncbi:proline-rich protein 2-like [Loxodonta africana]|uniref:proline-rich protein 2-like n=1 Tax=Loxodonta africana TaxID=9785 RepID=UPI0030D3CA0E
MRIPGQLGLEPEVVQGWRPALPGCSGENPELPYAPNQLTPVGTLSLRPRAVRRVPAQLATGPLSAAAEAFPSCEPELEDTATCYLYPVSRPRGGQLRDGVPKRGRRGSPRPPAVDRRSLILPRGSLAPLSPPPSPGLSPRPPPSGLARVPTTDGFRARSNRQPSAQPSVRGSERCHRAGTPEVRALRRPGETLAGRGLRAHCLGGQTAGPRRGPRTGPPPARTLGPPRRRREDPGGRGRVRPWPPGGTLGTCSPPRRPPEGPAPSARPRVRTPPHSRSRWRLTAGLRCCHGDRQMREAGPGLRLARGRALPPGKAGPAARLYKGARRAPGAGRGGRGERAGPEEEPGCGRSSVVGAPPG